jgi:hypothetical protein
VDSVIAHFGRSTAHWRLLQHNRHEADLMRRPLLVVCHEYRRSIRRYATVREMKEDPSRSAIRCCEQTRSILSQIDDLLAVAGTNKTKLLSANIWITDMAHFPEMNTVWDAWVSPATRQRGRPSKLNSLRPTTRSRSWWWRAAKSCKSLENRSAQPVYEKLRASPRATVALPSKGWLRLGSGYARSVTWVQLAMC